MRTRWIALAVATLGVLAGCSLDSITFVGGSSPDARIDGTIDTPMIDTPSGPVEIKVSTSTLMVPEGMTRQLAVSLTAPPPGALLVTLESSDDTKVGISPAAVLFSPSDWNTPQNVTVSGKQDADTVGETATITLRSTGVQNPLVINAMVNDDDGLSLVISAPMLDVGEGGTGTISAHLSAQPATTVVVMVTSANAIVATTSQPMLTFTPANYAIDQTITVTGMQDVDTTNNTTSIDFTSPQLTTSTLPIQVTDDDVLGIAVSTSAVMATEGGMTTFTVTLTQVPPGNTTVNVASALPAVATVSPSTLTFTTANYNVPQTVTVTAPNDDDVADNTTGIGLTSTGLANRTVAASIDDDDRQAIVAAPGTTLTVAEGGTSQLALSLAFRPTGTETIAVTSLDPMSATVTPAMVTFSSSNYATPQMVTIGGVQDPDAVPDSTTVRAESTALGLSKNVTVSVSEDDTLAIETSANMIVLTEGGMTTLDVRLTAQPTATTTVMIASGNTAIATATPGSLTFDTTNWNVYQPVTVRAIHDPDLAKSTTTITLGASGLPSVVVPVESNDDDMQAVVVSNTTVNVTEGSSTTVGVSLAGVPTGNVSVTVTSMLPAVATAAPMTLTFTPANYNMPQNVTITGTQDADAVNGTTMVSLTATGAAAAAIMVNVTDDETLNIDLSPTTLSVNEGGNATLNVRLTAMPPAATTLMIATSDATAANVSTTMLTFTTTNYNTFQPVTITGPEDLDAGGETVTITASATGLANQTATVTVVDNDPQTIVVSTNTVNLGEAGTATFNVNLSAQPSGATTVMLASSDGGAAMVSPTMLTFTTTNYAMGQLVTVTGVQDLDVGNEVVTISATATGIPTTNVTANVTDDDMQAVKVASSSVTVAEGNSTNVNVTLEYAPAGSVVVNIASLAPGVAGVTPPTLTFNASNYTTPQAISISGTEDPDAANGMTSVSLTLTGATPASVMVTVTDNDTLGIELSPASLAIGEGSTGTLQVRLTAEPPPGTTTVSLMSSNNFAASLSNSSVSFDSTDWNIYKNVTVFGVEDSNSTSENVTVTASSPGLTTKTADVFVTDNDVLGIAASPSNITVFEGQITTFTTFDVHLTAMPPGPVTVNVFNPDPGAVRVNLPPSMLMFTPANYSVDQAVAVMANDDMNSTDEIVVLTLSAPGMSLVTVTVNVIDDDRQAFVIAPKSLTISEDASFGGTFDVSLASAPVGNVYVSLGSTNPGVAGPTVSSLMFTPSDYNIPQTVHVTAVTDSNFDYNQAQIKVTAMGIPDEYVDVLVTEPRIIDAIDNPNPFIVGYLCSTAMNVRLLGNPLFPLTLSITTTGNVTTVPTFLTFDSSNWYQYLPVNVQSGEVPGPGNVTVGAPGVDSQSANFYVFDGPYCQ